MPEVPIGAHDEKVCIAPLKGMSQGGAAATEAAAPTTAATAAAAARRRDGAMVVGSVEGGTKGRRVAPRQPDNGVRPNAGGSQMVEKVRRWDPRRGGVLERRGVASSVGAAAAIYPHLGGREGSGENAHKPRYGVLHPSARRQPPPAPTTTPASPAATSPTPSPSRTLRRLHASGANLYPRHHSHDRQVRGPAQTRRRGLPTTPLG